MKAVQNLKTKKPLVSYYVRFDSSSIVTNAFLLIDGHKNVLKGSAFSPSAFSGDITLKKEVSDDKLHFELHGTYTGKSKSVTGEIIIKIQEMYLGSFSIHATSNKESFKYIIGDLVLNPPEEPTTFDVDVRDITYTGKEDESRTAEQTEFNIPWQYHLSDWIENYKSIDYHGQNNLDNFKLSPLSGYTRARVGSPPGGKESGYRDYTYIRNINNNPTPEIDPGGDVTVFYGTNRNREDDDKTDNYYGSELSALQQGLCVISIPPGHKQGALERPGKILWWRQSENPAKHIILRSIEPLTDSDYYNYLNKGFNNSDKKAALIFVHGFNTSFAESAWRCGQIAYDIPFPGITGFFSWPSGGKALDYLRDIERADASVSPLTQFIEDIVLHTHVEELHFIAHSMGNRILTRSLNQLIQKDSFKNSVATIAQIVLAAPDIDRDVFNNEIYPEFKGIGTRRTLYASNQDKALFLSEKLRIGLKRLGEGGADIYIADGIDTVDASNIISTGIHHSYIFEGKELLYDLNMLFIGGISPNKRRLRKMAKQVSGKTMNYWLFR